MKFKNITILSSTALLLGCATAPLSTTDEQQYIDKINTSLNNNNPATALAISKQFIKKSPASAIAYELQAKSYQQLSEYDNAEDSYLQALKLMPNNNVYRAEYAYLLCSDKQYSKAQSEYQKAYTAEQDKSTTNGISLQAKNYNLATIVSSTADCYNLQGLYDNAIESYELVLQNKDVPPSTYIGISKAYLAQQNYPKAALYISSYPGDENESTALNLKLAALNGLLNGNYSLSTTNRKLLQTKIALLSQKQRQPQSASDKVTAPIVATTSTTPITTNTSVPAVKNSITKPAPIIAGMTNNNASAKAAQVSQSNSTAVTKPLASESLATQRSRFKKRIQSTKTGKHYIIVEPQDTLFNISQRSGVGQQQLITRNHLKNDAVPLGIKLYLD